MDRYEPGDPFVISLLLLRFRDYSTLSQRASNFADSRLAMALASSRLHWFHSRALLGYFELSLPADHGLIRTRMQPVQKLGG